MAHELHFDVAALAALDGPFRAHLMNSATGFKPANLVGTRSPDGAHNLAILSSIVHLGSDPALIGCIFRPEVPRERGSHTLHNARETGEFTVSQVGTAWYRQAHATSARYPDGTSEFEAVGLTPWFFPVGNDGKFSAPAVAESPVRIALRWEDSYTLPANGCTFVVGRVVGLSVPAEAVAADGALDLVGMQTAAISGLDGYHAVERLERLAYAKPHVPPTGTADFLAGFPRSGGGTGT
jgi:flavin reductase (DIM6/NTAB) family NADH-FMN oxidoreductase RutF